MKVTMVDVEVEVSDSDLLPTVRELITQALLGSAQEAPPMDPAQFPRKRAIQRRS